MKLAELLQLLETIAPQRFAEPWDNVGLLVGDPAADISRVLLTIDYTAAVADEARSAGCQLVIAYHPPIFDAVKRLTAGNRVFDAIRDGIALYSPHTALDVADGGTNDMLADVLDLRDRAPLRPAAAAASSDYKLVTFVPAENIEAVSAALFAAGAGRIGDYTSCGFRVPGEGTFFGQPGTNPAAGQSGRLEKVSELRLETLVPIARAAAAIQALRESHPYEEPAFDLYPLATASEHGMGRIGTLPGVSRRQLFDRIKEHLRIPHLLVAGPADGLVHRAAVCAGSCGRLLHDALAAGADLFLTGEVRHHDALAAGAAGMTVVCALHSNSERPVLARVQARLDSLAPALKISISHADRDPLSVF